MSQRIHSRIMMTAEVSCRTAHVCDHGVGAPMLTTAYDAVIKAALRCDAG
jgi:hypothetical protein